MEAYCKASITDIDPIVYVHIILASFCSISCRVFAVRQLGDGVNQVCVFPATNVHTLDGLQSEARSRICRDIHDFKAIVNSTRDKGQIRDIGEEDRLCSLMHMALVFETEQCCMLRDWAAVLASIEVRDFHVRLATLMAWSFRKPHGHLR